jgi:8-oxo-dGTP diphosphatase
VACLGPRDPVDIAGPQALSGVVDRPLNFTVRCHRTSVPTLGVFAAIFDDGGRILCVRMNYATRGWTTPGGRVEPGESPLIALRREVLEESGLDVVAEGLVGVYSKPQKDDLVLFLRARVLGQLPWQPNAEISHIGYFGRDELPEPMGLGVRTRILDALDGTIGVVRVIPES